MQRRPLLVATLWVVLLADLGGCASAPSRSSREEAVAQVTQTEIAFAKTMADRDFAAFQGFIADEAVFFDGDQPLRGKAAVAEAWKKLFARPVAPFSWRPQQVEVLASGTLARSTGPVTLPDGRVEAAFDSTWRLEADGRWRIVFDAGHEICHCAKAP